MKPFPQSFWVVDRRLCAGHYPGDLDPGVKEAKLRGLLDCGIQHVISLMEPDETGVNGQPFDPYPPQLEALAREYAVRVDCLTMPIPDNSVPTRAGMQAILDRLEDALVQNRPTYVHCWGGHGRTSTVVACYLIRQGLSPQAAVQRIEAWRRPLPKNHYPFTGRQAGFILEWSNAG